MYLFKLTNFSYLQATSRDLVTTGDQNTLTPVGQRDVFVFEPMSEQAGTGCK